MLVAVVISALIGFSSARGTGSMNVGIPGVGIAIALICALFGAIIGAVLSSGVLATLFVSALVGAVVFGGTRLAQR